MGENPKSGRAMLLHMFPRSLEAELSVKDDSIKTGVRGVNFVK